LPLLALASSSSSNSLKSISHEVCMRVCADDK